MGQENFKLNSIKEAIVKTIVFFDLFDYPLTSWEIWQYGLWGKNKISYSNVLEILDSDKLNNAISERSGFYFLHGRSRIIKARMDRYNYSDRKFKRALLIVRIFKLIPWIKMIAVSNIIGSHNLKKGSDIDIFIITEKDRIWLTRLICASLMKLLGQRPKPGDKKDKICLNFYLSMEKMNLKNYLLNDIDIYFIYWLACLTPVYDTDDTYKKFVKANNWIAGYLPNWQEAMINSKRSSKKIYSDFYYDIVDLLFGGLEFNAINFQLRRLPKQLKKLMNMDTRIVINNQVLKLHAEDQRAEYRQKWEQLLVDIELKNWMLQ